MSIIKTEYNEQNNIKKNTQIFLFILHWDRIILDNILINYDDNMIDSFIQNTSADFRWLTTHYNLKEEMNVIPKIAKYIIKTNNKETDVFNDNVINNGIMDRIISIKYKDIKYFLSHPNIVENHIDFFFSDGNITTSNDTISSINYEELPSFFRGK